MEDIVWNDAKGHDLNYKDFEESSWKMSLLKHWWWCWCWCWWWGQMWVLLGVKCIQSFVIQDEFSTFMHLIQELNWIHYCMRNPLLGNIVEPFLDIWAPGNSNFKKFFFGVWGERSVKVFYRVDNDLQSVKLGASKHTTATCKRVKKWKWAKKCENAVWKCKILQNRAEQLQSRWFFSTTF